MHTGAASWLVSLQFGLMRSTGEAPFSLIDDSKLATVCREEKNMYYSKVEKISVNWIRLARVFSLAVRLRARWCRCACWIQEAVARQCYFQLVWLEVYSEAFRAQRCNPPAGQSVEDIHPSPLPSISTLIGSESGDPCSPTGGGRSGPVPLSGSPASFGNAAPW